MTECGGVVEGGGRGEVAWGERGALTLHQSFVCEDVTNERVGIVPLSVHTMVG